MNNKIIVTALIALMAAESVAFAPDARALSGSVSTSVTEATVNTTFDLPIEIADAIDLHSVYLELNYDPAVLDYDSVGAGALMINGCSLYMVSGSEYEPGRAYLLVDRLDCAGTNGDGIAGYVRFRALSVGTTALTFANQSLEDSNGDSLAATWTNGSLTVTAAALPTVTLTPATATIAPSDLHAVTLNVNGVSDLVQVWTDIGFDPAVLRYDHIDGLGYFDEGDPSALVSVDDSAAGNINILADISATSNIVNGNAAVFTVYFEALANGTSPLTPANSMLSDTLFENITANWSGASVTVFQPSAAVRLSPQSGNTSVGGTYDVSIMLDDADGVGGLWFDLTYDVAHLAYGGYAGAGIFDPVTGDPNALISVDDSVTGRLNILVDASTAGLLNGNRTVMTVTFNTLSAGSAALGFDNGVLYDDTWVNELPATFTGGSVNLTVVDVTAPVLAVVTPVSTPTGDSTPNFTFSSTEDGTIAYQGDCSSPATVAAAGSNAITYNALSNGIHSNCQVRVTDAASNASAWLAVPSFTVDTARPRVQSVNSDFANGTYGPGTVIDIDVAFNEAVTSGAVTVTLETGAVDRNCTFSVTNGTTGTCNYTVQSGDTSADLTVSTIAGTITDQAGNQMTNFAPITNLAANKAIRVDGVAPTVPGAAAALVNGANVTVSWNASSDTNGIRYYTVYRNAVAIGTTTLLTYTQTGVTDGTYAYSVDALDTVGNRSARSADASATVGTPDNVAPVRSAGVPSGTLAAGTAAVTLSVSTNEVAACRYATVANTAYGAMPGTLVATSSGTLHQIPLSGLVNGTAYNYYIRCQDQSANANNEDYALGFSVANPSSGGGGGGGGGGSLPKPPAPSAIIYEKPVTAPAAVRDSARIILNWQNPSDTDYSETIVIRTVTAIDSSLTYEAAAALGTIVYRGTAATFTDTAIEPNQGYYYAIYSKNKTGQYSHAVLIARSAPASKPAAVKPETTPPPATGNSEKRSLYGLSGAEVNAISLEEAKTILGQDRRVELNTTTKRLYDLIIGRSPHVLNDNERYAIAFYIHEGTETTQILGAGERTGALNSYRSAFTKLPRTEAEWQDVIKIANGRWPTERSVASEKRAQQTLFIAVYQRSPVMAEAHDNAAVTVIAYGLRPGNRNMNSERAGISIFKAIFGKAPTEATDWDVVRAIAYSGAVR